jgi:hypothetical protein
VSRVVAAHRMLDLDHACAEIGEDHGAIRARQHAREVEHRDTVQRSWHRSIVAMKKITVYSGSH